MKILQIITLADLGGAQSVLINLSEKLIADGHNVIVVSESEGPMWDILSEKVIKIKIKSLQRSINPIKDFITTVKLHKLYRKYNPDVIHLHSSKIGLLGRLAFPKSKIIYTVHGFDSIRIANPKFLFLERLLKKRAKYIVAVSQYDFKYLHKEKIDKNICCIYNGVSDHILRKKIVPSNLFAGINSKYDFIILAIARLSAQKKFDLFCEIASLLNNKSIAFIWIGNQYQPDDIPENVYCLGSIKNAYQYIPFVDLCILPSNYEGLPISIIESLIFSKPVIASNVGGISEILDGTNGFALENKPELFVDRIMFYLQNKEAYNLACEAVRKTYEDKFTVEQMCTKYLSLYQSIVNSR
jgi:glycosyltransferase involved in cell wall biosynthesis